MKIKLFVLVILVSFFASCGNNEPEVKKPEKKIDTYRIKTRKIESGSYEYADKEVVMIADTIYYKALIKDPKNEEKSHLRRWLKNTDVKAFSGVIFRAVYSKRVKAYRYGNELTIKEVRDFEKEFKRNRVGQVLFEETWYFDEKKMQMFKKVNSVLLGYERYYENNVAGYIAGIKVYLNDTTFAKTIINQK